MRKFYAWLLLIVSTAQWIGGHICFEVQYFIEAPQEITAAEQTISKDIFEETGVETTVSVLPDSQHVRWGTDYGNYFEYSKTDSTGTVFFTIDYAPRSTVWEDVAVKVPVNQDQDKAPNTSLLKQLFAEFLFPSAALPAGIKDDLIAINFQESQLAGQLRSSPLSPPPDNFYC
jgi:hypothetical protein